MTTLTIATGYDSKGKRDASCVFIPEARAFRALHGGSFLELVSPDTAAKRRSAVESAIRATPGLDVLAVFGHGVTSGLIATGHVRGRVESLAGAIASVHPQMVPRYEDAPSEWTDIVSCETCIAPRRVRINASGPLSIILYACLTARGKTGFADVLADDLTQQDTDHVFAHSTPGHATWNPYVELAGGPNGGDPIFSPREPGWKRWRDRLRDEQAFRLSFWRAAHGLPRAMAIEAIRENAGR